MFKTLKDFSFFNKRVLLRCDFNVPLDKNGKILDDFRIKQALPTIEYLTEQGAKIILMSHLGDPDGKVVPELSLAVVGQRLSDLLKISIGVADNCIGPEIESEVNNLKPGSILLLENLRFYKEETHSTSSGQADLDFAKKLSFLGDIYVNDAFGVCHRNNASISLLPSLLPSCAGLLLEKEIKALDAIMNNPEKPMIAIIGGKKVETKSKFIENISNVADFVIVSGLIAKEMQEKGIKFPALGGSALGGKYPEKIVTPVGDLGALDISDESIKIFQEKISVAKTVLWNGPFGKFEEKEYAKGSLAIANAIISSGAFSVVGGGETVEFITKNGIIDKFSHVSTGGGAMLSYLSGETLPGIEALG